MKQEITQERLEYGKEYQLYNTLYHPLGGGNQIKAVYLGYKPQKEQDSTILDGWGHLFYRKHEGKLEFYIAKSTKELRLCDGEDDPSYPVGIQAYRTDRIDLTENEIGYLEWLLNTKNKEIAA